MASNNGRKESRGECRKESRGECRKESRGEGRKESRGEGRKESRTEGRKDGKKESIQRREPRPMSIPPQMRLSELERLSPGSVPTGSKSASPGAESALSLDDDWEASWGVDFDSDEGADEPQPQTGAGVATPSWASKVQTLNGFNYYDFIAGAEKCLVIFYNPFQCESVFPKMQFQYAAIETQNPQHRFARVDCTVEKTLCLQEQILKTPVYKLYSNGFSLSTIKEADKMNADQLRMLVAMTPVLHQSRLDIGKEFLKTSSEIISKGK
ncbi:hypothetical protein BsWGS_16983 [Bradybaena similaris]